jgi:hypothetical protein
LGACARKEPATLIPWGYMGESVSETDGESAELSSTRASGLAGGSRTFPSQVSSSGTKGAENEPAERRGGQDQELMRRDHPRYRRSGETAGGEVIL